MSTTEMALAGPEVEVVAKASRRRFTMEYKRKMVREADGCKTPGAVGALLRREGLYSSHLTVWRGPGARGVGGGAQEAGPGAAGPRPARQEDRRAGTGDHTVAEAR